MTTIQLIGNVANKRATFRQELKSLAKDWELHYTFDYMCLAESSIMIICKRKDGHESLTTMLIDCDEICQYLEQWTEFKTSSISIY